MSHPQASPILTDLAHPSTHDLNAALSLFPPCPQCGTVVDLIGDAYCECAFCGGVVCPNCAECACDDSEDRIPLIDANCFEISWGRTWQ